MVAPGVNSKDGDGVSEAEGVADRTSSSVEVTAGVSSTTLIVAVSAGLSVTSTSGVCSVGITESVSVGSRVGLSVSTAMTVDVSGAAVRVNVGVSATARIVALATGTSVSSTWGVCSVGAEFERKCRLGSRCKRVDSDAGCRLWHGGMGDGRRLGDCADRRR